MDSYLIDNNILNFWFNERAAEHPAVMGHVRARSRRNIFTSVIIIGEIEDGHHRIPNPTQDQRDRQNELRGFIQQHFPQPLIVTRDTSEYYGEMRASLFRACYPDGRGPRRLGDWRWLADASAKELRIDENDLWITSQAVERNMVFVTHDQMEPIRAVAPGSLYFEDWTQPLPAFSPR